MTKLIESLQTLKNYRFTLQSYKLNHSELELSAINPDDPSLRFKIGFMAVYYFQLPISWIGSFKIGSDSEQEAIIRKTGLSLRESSSGVKLYKSLDGEVLILGALGLITPGDSAY
ncbi:MAG TPA: hypothetical protein VJM08_14880 [Anaerolineales bacterium]|nr:hypothetical protein [Anaerolineales bacterium]